LASMSTSSSIIASCAYRAKYRITDKEGRAIKFMLRVETSGVHKGNRASVYPAGVACKRLCGDVLPAGFLKEEIYHVGVAVQEPPPEELIRRSGPPEIGVLKFPADRKSSLAYNVDMCSKDGLLKSCFDAPFDRVEQTWLSHNHMMLVMRAFITGAEWNMPPDTDKNITFCDVDGKLSLSAVAASPNGKEMKEAIEEGFPCEMLSWKMDLEEPEAASVISQALNEPQSMSMRTTELTAISVLKGEIMFQMAGVSQHVAFQTVRDRVRHQLATAADDPDLPELFDFLISNGVGKNTYIDQFMEWTGRYVDSKRRQLRFTAWYPVNKMCPEAVWARMAVLKRAYRKQPQNTYCPCPESAWGEFNWDALQLLEDLLRFFHVSCLAHLNKLGDVSRIMLLGNIDIAAADAFFVAKAPKLRLSTEKIQKALLDATRKFMEPMGLMIGNSQYLDLPDRKLWIEFPKEAGTAATPKEAEVELIAPRVLTFSESTGRQLNDQEEYAKVKDRRTDAKPLKMPWREWQEGMGLELGQPEADIASAVAVLHCLHAKVRQCGMPIDVWKHDGTIYVTANRAAEQNAIMLPPCVPKQSKVLDKSEHPYKIRIHMKVLAKSVGDDALTDEKIQDAKIERESIFFVNPEFTEPKPSDPTTTVAKPSDSTPAVAKPSDPTPAVAAAGQSNAAETEWSWGPTMGSQTMHPFWAVRRMTEQQLRKHNATSLAKGQVPSRFNCRLVPQNMTMVTVGVANGNALNCTRSFDVPFLCNNEELLEGEELLLRVEEKKIQVAQKNKRTWKDAQAEQDTIKKKTKSGTRA
jgi:hypothetical protein